MSIFKPAIKPNETADMQLLKEYRQSGDLAVLGKLYEPYMPLVYGVCLKYLNDEESAQDAVMQIFEELVEKAKRHEITQFRGWLYVLARNHCLMQLRSSKKAEHISLDEFMENSFILHPDDAETSEETVQALEKCMEKLTAAQKQSVSLFFYDEKCYKEIAEQTGYTLNEVKSYIQNGKRNLKNCLEKNGER